MKLSIKTLSIVAVLAFFTGDLFSQYLNDQGEVRLDKIIDELKEFEDASANQRALAETIAENLHREINVNPVLQENRDLRNEALGTLVRLRNRLGNFGFLRRSSGLSTWEKKRKLDTISVEALMIESKIQSLNDSLYALYDRLIDITQRGDEETRATKEKAALQIGKSPFYDHIEYIFENHRDMNFGYVLDRFGDADFSVYRSGMVGLTANLERDERSMYEWRLMPFLLKYWGDADWTANLSPSHYEVVLFINMTHTYEQRESLFEFMRANAKDPDTEIYTHFEEFFFR